MAWAMTGVFAEAHVLSVALDAFGGGRREVVESREQSAAADAARKFCQMGRMLGAVSWDKAGRRAEARHAACSNASCLVGATEGLDFFGGALKVRRVF